VKKPKIVCVIGSGILAPLTFGVLVAAALLLDYFLPPFTPPLWSVRVAEVALCVITPMQLWLCYDMYFEKCYQPQT
jgi:hypothetical protein